MVRFFPVSVIHRQTLCGMDKVSKLEHSGPNEASLTLYEYEDTWSVNTSHCCVIEHTSEWGDIQKGVGALEPSYQLDTLVMAAVKR